MSKHISTYFSRGLKVNTWQNDKGKSISVEKSRKTDSGSYETAWKGTLFPEEAFALAGLLIQAACECSMRGMPNRSEETDDMPI